MAPFVISRLHCFLAYRSCTRGMADAVVEKKDKFRLPGVGVLDVRPNNDTRAFFVFRFLKVEKTVL